MTKEVRYFKIRDTETGLFSLGGWSSPGHMGYYGRPNGWSKTGKMWKGTGPLKNHLNSFNSISPKWEIVEYEVSISEKVNPISVVDFIKEKRDLEKSKELEEQRKRNEFNAKRNALIQSLSEEQKTLLGLK